MWVSISCFLAILPSAFSLWIFKKESRWEEHVIVNMELWSEDVRMSDWASKQANERPKKTNFSAFWVKKSTFFNPFCFIITDFELGLSYSRPLMRNSGANDRYTNRDTVKRRVMELNHKYIIYIFFQKVA